MATKFNAVVTSEATNSQITSEGNKSLITRGYAEEFYSGGGGSGTDISIGQYTSTDTATNINTVSFTVIPFNSTDSITDTGNYTINSGRVTVAEEVSI